MNIIATDVEVSALQESFSPTAPAHAAAILAAAHLLLPHLERGEKIDAAILRSAMEAAFGASDASGAWRLESRL